MKNIALLFAVVFAIVSCGKKGWDATSEKAFLDKCKVEAGTAAAGGTNVDAACACMLQAAKDAKMTPDQVMNDKKEPNAELTAKMDACITSNTTAPAPAPVDTTSVDSSAATHTTPAPTGH